MLSVLTLRQLAIVESLEVEFGTGFSVITGESGSGKSMLLLGLSLALGSKADATQIRTGAERAEVSAVFDTQHLPEAQAWLMDRAMDDTHEVIVRRVLTRDGRSRAFINGTQVSLAELRQLSGLLLEIYGQHEHQTLLRREVQRRVLDRFAGLESLSASVQGAWQNWQALVAALTRTEEQKRVRQERMEKLLRQQEELAELGLKSGELQEIEKEYDLLAHVDSRREHLMAAIVVLDQDNSGVLRQLRLLSQHVSALPESDNEWLNLADSALNTLSELEHELRYSLDHLEADPERLNWLDERLASVHRIARKFYCEAGELVQREQEIQDELRTLQESMDEQVLRLQVTDAADRYRELAGRLSQRRQEESICFADQVMQHFPALGMKYAHLQFRLLPLEVPDSRGLEDVEIIFSANPGQEARPLVRVASGGELSRISLALQVVYAQTTGIPTLVFDEVDVGVSGSVAEAVGHLLRRLGQHAQILCITHQPQVAALGHDHWRVEKQVFDNTVTSRMQRLNSDQRIDELARLSGGLEITQATMDHARALLKAGM